MMGVSPDYFTPPRKRDRMVAIRRGMRPGACANTQGPGDDGRCLRFGGTVSMQFGARSAAGATGAGTRHRPCQQSPTVPPPGR